jgi:alpha-tubulin suppressor-like RCC1 family protein
MLARIKATIIVLLALAWPELGAAQSCVQSGIAAGGDHTCAFTTPGSAMCWGDNSFGQNGNGTFNTPTPVPTVVVPSSLPGQPPPFQLVAGQRHTCATLLPGGIAVCWGDDTSGQLGDGRSGAGVFSPTEVPVVDPNTARPLSADNAVAAGDQHSCALICPNQPCNVRCWGDNTVGQLGIGSAGGTSATPSNPVTFPPTPFIPSNPPPAAITAGGLHTCAVMQDN